MTAPPPDRPARPAPADALPPAFIGAVVAISAAPGLLHVAGVDLGARTPPLMELLGLPDEAALHRALRGAFLHSLLEAAALGVATMTVALAWIHARLSVSLAPPLLALALLVAGVMDLFHITASNYLLGPILPTGSEFIPFTWAISRLLMGVALVTVGAALVLRPRWEEVAARRLFLLMAVTLLSASVVMAAWAALAPELPRTLVPDGVVHRPFDLAALVLFLIAGGLLFRVSRRRPSLFAGSLVLSVVPAVAAQLHMAFGSPVLYDHDFMAGHLLKVVSYAVPFFGLGLDYLRARAGEISATAQKVEAEVRESEAAARARTLAEFTRQLERRNRDLDEFAYVASHDLRAPLRGIRNLATWIEEDLASVQDGSIQDNLRLMRERVEAMDRLVEGLLHYSRVGRSRDEPEDVDLGDLTREVWDFLAPERELRLRLADDLPVLHGERIQLQQVLQNLLGNAAKFARSRVEVAARAVDGAWEVQVRDDGPGIAADHHERIWVVFQQVPVAEGVPPGTGMGLAIVKKIVERNGGLAWVESEPGQGACFHFTWPVGANAPQPTPGETRPRAPVRPSVVEPGIRS